MKYYNTITAITVGRETENPVFGECTRIKLEDETGGMFLVFEQDGEDQTHQVRIDFREWGNICEAVLTLMEQPLVK